MYDEKRLFLMRKTVVALHNCCDLFFLIGCVFEYQKSLEKEKSSWSVSRVLFLI